MVLYGVYLQDHEKDTFYSSAKKAVILDWEPLVAAVSIVFVLLTMLGMILFFFFPNRAI
jgi:hypothetical protein